LQYRNMVNCCRYVDNISNMNNRKKLKNREKIAKQIAKTSDSICKKYRVLKTGKMEEDIALERHFKPIVELLKQIVENTISEKSQSIKREANIVKDISIKKKRGDNDNDDKFWMDD